MRKKEFCQRGHRNWRIEASSGDRYCATCRIDRIRIRLGQVPKTEYLAKMTARTNSPICPSGHEGEVYITNAGTRRCRTCDIDRHRHLRMEVLLSYGGECACCHEWRYEFLEIDHIEGGGRKHILSLNGQFYRWLKQNNFPDGFRVLCSNCNHSRGKYGYCPHHGTPAPGNVI